MRRTYLITFLGIACFLVFFLFWQNQSRVQLIANTTEPTAPLGLPKVPWPSDNLYDKRKVELGKFLYYDPRLSSNGTVSCASCHMVENAFADHEATSSGIDHQKGSRNSPTVINAAYQRHYFWDGRALTLEEQSKGPLGNSKEMTTAKDIHEAHQECHQRVNKIEGYRVLFKEVFGHEECGIDDIVKAIATFERTILSGNSPYDRYMAGDRSAMSSEAIAGLQVFNKVGCANCHAGFNFSDGRFHNIGVGMENDHPDLGRYEITKEMKDYGAFKTPTLRECTKNWPYMHDGSLLTMEDVIDYYDKGGIPNKNLHPLMKPLHLSSEQKKALLAFLHALEGEGWQNLASPTSFPE